MDITQTPHLNQHLQEVMRPLAEKLRSVLYGGQAALATHIELMGALGAAAQANPDAVLIDGRAHEGVRPVTVGEALTACQFLVDMLQWSQAPEQLERGTTALKFCVRPMRTE